MQLRAGQEGWGQVLASLGTRRKLGMVPTVFCRDAYLAALESVSIDQDIPPFARFVAEQLYWSLEQAA